MAVLWHAPRPTWSRLRTAWVLAWVPRSRRRRGRPPGRARHSNGEWGHGQPPERRQALLRRGGRGLQIPACGGDRQEAMHRLPHGREVITYMGPSYLGGAPPAPAPASPPSKPRAAFPNVPPMPPAYPPTLAPGLKPERVPPRPAWIAALIRRLVESPMVPIVMCLLRCVVTPSHRVKRKVQTRVFLAGIINRYDTNMQQC